MYKLLLCIRYLRTRYIALASIVSVTLGVATMIVVNSVMAGFTIEMQDRIHGILSDISFEYRSLTGMPDPQRHMLRIKKVAGDYIDSMTATVHVPAMLSFQINGNGETITKSVQLIGIDVKTKGDTCKFNEYLQHPSHRPSKKYPRGKFDFRLQEGGYDVRSQGIEDAPLRSGMEFAGWGLRRERARRSKERKAWERSQEGADEEKPFNPFDIPGRKADVLDEMHVFDPAKDQQTGCVLGIALASYRAKGVKDEERFLLLPGDDVQLTFPTAGTPPKAVSDSFTVVDFYESKMSEYDGAFVFVPIEKLQELRGMFERQTGKRFVTSIQIKLKDEDRGDVVRDLLRTAFSPQFYSIQTWRDKQGPLLAAVQMETMILNVLLFLIIAVAGFGILAIFFMIVVEKTKDIGILKSLGAGSGGIAGIFVAYGMSLGAVGAGAGMACGLLFVKYINQIAGWLSWLTGHQIFDPEIYYFYEIPTSVNPLTVAWIVAGALLIAVGASVLPACRAARFHPVEALRYE